MDANEKIKMLDLLMSIRSSELIIRFRRGFK